jgi:cytochrome c
MKLSFIKPMMLIIFFSANIANANSDMEVRAGEHLYTQCTGCHAPDYNRTGPKHCGISGRAAGGVETFSYTNAMKNSGIIWNRESLNEFLISPFKMIPGTSMGFAGIDSERERQQLITYMIQLDENNPLCK